MAQFSRELQLSGIADLGYFQSYASAENKQNG